MDESQPPADADRARSALSRLRDGDAQARRRVNQAVKAVGELLKGEALRRFADELGSVLEQHLPATAEESS